MPIYCLFPFADSFAVASSFSFSFSCLCCCCCTSQKLQWQIHGNGHLPLPALHAHAELAKMPTGCNGAHPPPPPPPLPVQANIRPHDNTLISATGWRRARLEPNNGRGLIELQQLRESLYCHAVKCATCWDPSCAQTHVRVHCTFHLNNKYSEQTFNLCETSLRFKGPNRICLVAMGIRGTCISGTW